jgi:hypothetical protein
MPKESDQLLDEAERISTMLEGKVVKHIFRHRNSELVIQFHDGTRFFIDTLSANLELSIT